MTPEKDTFDLYTVPGVCKYCGRLIKSGEYCRRHRNAEPPAQPEASPVGSQHFAEMHMREAEEAESTRPSPEKPPARCPKCGSSISTVYECDNGHEFQGPDIPDHVQHGVGPKCPQCKSDDLVLWRQRDAIHDVTCNACAGRFDLETVADFAQFFAPLGTQKTIPEWAADQMTDIVQGALADFGAVACDKCGVNVRHIGNNASIGIIRQMKNLLGVIFGQPSVAVKDEYNRNYKLAEQKEEKG